MELQDLYIREAKFDVGAVEKAYSDASVTIHFLFITKTQMSGTDISERNPVDNIILVEKSEDIFSAFSEIAPGDGRDCRNLGERNRSFSKSGECFGKLLPHLL